MRRRISAKGGASLLFLSLFGTYFSTPATAKENYFDKVPECPLVAPLRVATSSSLGDFQSLRDCSQQMVSTPPVTVTDVPPVARIMGVKATSPAALKPAPEDRPARERRRCRGSRCATSFQASFPAGAATLVPMASHRNAMAYDDLIRQTAGAYRIDPLFLHALTWTESAYRPTAVSSAGARGLMQIMPATGRGLGVAQEHLFDPAVNVDAGARLLKKLQRRYGRDLPLILAAYNAGEGAVARYGGRIPPYRETQDYVRTVMQRYGTLRTQGSGGAGLAR